MKTDFDVLSQGGSLDFEIVTQGGALDFEIKNTKTINASGTLSEDFVRDIVSEETAHLQPKRDENLKTKSKEVVFAINELFDREDKQGLTQEQVKAIVSENAVTKESDPTVPEWAKEPKKPKYKYSEIEGTPNIPSVEGLASEEKVKELVDEVKGIAEEANEHAEEAKRIADTIDEIAGSALSIANNSFEYAQEANALAKEAKDVASTVDNRVEKTVEPNQLYGTDENGNPALYPTDSVGTQVKVGGKKVKEFNADTKQDVLPFASEPSETNKVVTENEVAKAKEIVVVDIMQMIATQDNASFVDLSKRYINGEIAIIGNVIIGNSICKNIIVSNIDCTGEDEYAWTAILSNWAMGENQDLSYANIAVFGIENKNGVLSLGSRTIPVSDFITIDEIRNLPNHFTLTDEEMAKWREMTNSVGKGDIASQTAFGIVRGNTSNGVGVSKNGYLYCEPSYNSEIDAKKTHRKPIVPSVLDYAVKVGITTNTETLTDEEKASACRWIGATKLYLHRMTDKNGETITVIDSSSTQKTPLEMVEAFHANNVINRNYKGYSIVRTTLFLAGVVGIQIEYLIYSTVSGISGNSITLDLTNSTDTVTEL